MGISDLFNLFNSRSLLALDLSSGTLKLVCAKKAGNRKEVAFLASKPLSGLSDDDISKVLAGYLKEWKIKKTGLILSIPSNLVIPKNIEVPSVDPQEIREIVSLQAGRHTPYSKEEVIVDYIPIGTLRQNYSKVLLLIVASSVIKKQFALVEKAGLTVQKVVFSQEAVAALANRLFKLTDAISPAAILHIDESATDFTVVFKNKVIFIRSISMGRQQLTADAEKSKAKFCEEIKKTLEAYQSENIEKNPSGLLLTGAVFGLDGLDDVLNQAVNIPVRTTDFYENISFDKKAKEGVLNTKGLSFLNVIAPVLACQELKANFIPEEIKLKKALQQRGRDLIKTGFLSLVLIVLVFLVFISKIYFKAQYLAILNDKFKTLSQDTGEVEKILQRNSQIRNFMAERGYSLKVLKELYDLIPLNVELNDIRFDREGKFVIRGTAESMGTVFSFLEAMGGSRYFKDPKPKNTSQRQEGKKDVTDFEINASLNKAGER
jgi:type IV pilus assembly protein PilM